MSTHGIRLHPNTYLDSVKLLVGSRAILETPGIDWGAAVTGTPANVEVLIHEGFPADELVNVGANDLVIAARGEQAELALANAETALFSVVSTSSAASAGPSIRSIEETATLLNSPNVAVISVGGDYAALEAHKALTASMDVLLFSDNVSLEDEVDLKGRAAAAGLFMMGPGAGTAVIGGVGLGFANAVRNGPVGVVAAAGTGAQEVMSLIDRVGLGVTQVIGVGGRDLSEAVGGIMTAHAIRSLEDDPATEVILLVSKPPSVEVSRQLLNRPAVKPLVATLIGLREPIEVSAHVTLTPSLEEGVVAVTAAIGGHFSPIDEDTLGRTSNALAKVDTSRTAIRGLFSGGTLCFEAMTLMSEQGLSVYSNTPLEPEWDVAVAPPSAHICLDLGEEEYTRGRPHPMIDPAARLERIVQEGTNPHTAVVLIDVVLGYGSHDDPAGQLAPACADVIAIDGGPQVVAYVLGTEGDPQGLAGQRKKLEDVGCIVAATNARAALTATAIATRKPAISQFRSAM